MWLFLMGLNLKDSYAEKDAFEPLDLSTPSGTTGAALSQRGVYYRGSRIGFIRERLSPLEQGYRAEQTGELTLNVLGRERQMRIEGSVTTLASGALAEFDFRLRTSSGRSPFETVIRGVVNGDALELNIRSARSERSEVRELDEPIVLPLNLYYSLAGHGWTSGETYQVRLFDPMTLAEGDATVAVKDAEIVRWGSREEEAFRLQTTFAGLTTTAWVSETGEVLKEETPLGWTLIKEAPGSGLEVRGDRPPNDVAILSAVPAIGFSGDASSLNFAELRLVDFPGGFDELDGGRQHAEGDTVTITIDVSAYADASILSPDARRDALAADAFAQSDDVAIIEQATRIAEGLSAEDTARALNDWVFSHVSKSPTLSLPSAVEVLEQRVGDCNEHTVLFVALARASGLPTRIATGLAYTGGQFYYHAWPEVWIDAWVPVDPTFGQFPADPLHVRLLTGGLETQYEILKLLGRGATIEVLRTE